MVFDNLISFANDVDFQATSICTEWKSVKKYEDRDDYPNYDYFPEVENGKIVGFFGKDKQGNIKKVKGKKSFFINEKTNILETIVSLNKNYSLLKNERIKGSFVILGTAEEPFGLITLADLNKEPVSILIWRIIRRVEMNLKKKIGEVDPKQLKKAIDDENKFSNITKRHNKLEKNRMDIDLANVLSLSEIMKLIKDKREFSNLNSLLSEKLDQNIIDFRNKVSHHRTYKSLLTQAKEIQKLYIALENLDQIIQHI